MNIFETNHLINLVLLTVIIVYIIDISGIIDAIKSLIVKFLSKGKLNNTDFRLRPFDCSLCMTFWIGLIYLICIGKFTIPMIALVCLLSYATTWIKDLILLIDELINRMFRHVINFH